MIASFLVVAGILFFFLSIVWNRKENFFNLFLKVGFGLMAVWALIDGLLLFGFHS